MKPTNAKGRRTPVLPGVGTMVYLTATKCGEGQYEVICSGEPDFREVIEAGEDDDVVGMAMAVFAEKTKVYPSVRSLKDEQEKQ